MSSSICKTDVMFPGVRSYCPVKSVDHTPLLSVFAQMPELTGGHGHDAGERHQEARQGEREHSTLFFDAVRIEITSLRALGR